MGDIFSQRSFSYMGLYIAGNTLLTSAAACKHNLDSSIAVFLNACGIHIRVTTPFKKFVIPNSYHTSFWLPLQIRRYPFECLLTLHSNHVARHLIHCGRCLILLRKVSSSLWKAPSSLWRAPGSLWMGSLIFWGRWIMSTGVHSKGASVRCMRFCSHVREGQTRIISATSALISAL